MTAALQIVVDAATTAGVIDPRDSIADADAQFILRRLNRMIGVWANERLLIFETYIDALPLVAAQPSYSSSLLSHGNPMQWDNAFVRLSGVDHQVELVDQQRYNAIGYKPAPGIPTMLYVNTDWPDSTMNFFPTPIGGLTAYIGARQALTPTLVLATDVSLPPGYEAALVDNLAVDISPSYGMQPNPQLVETARNERTVLKRNNHIALEMELPFRGRGRFNIYSGANG